MGTYLIDIIKNAVHIGTPSTKVSTWKISSIPDDDWCWDHWWGPRSQRRDLVDNDGDVDAQEKENDARTPRDSRGRREPAMACT